MAHCAQYSAVSRGSFGSPARDIKHRTGVATNGNSPHDEIHVNPSTTTEHVNSTFATTIDNWVNNLNYWTTTYPPVAGQPYTISWIGDVGIGLCKPNSMHGSARAVDLTFIRFTRPDGVTANFDAAWSWKSAQALIHRRRYLAIAAQCRRYFHYVLTAWYEDDADCIAGEETAHDDHIHFDNTLTSGPINDSLKSDTTLVQASCNLLNGESLSLDGCWGSLTEAAYDRLLADFNLSCRDARDSTANKNTFLSYVVRTAFANRDAGYYQSALC